MRPRLPVFFLVVFLMLAPAIVFAQPYGGGHGGGAREGSPVSEDASGSLITDDSSVTFSVHTSKLKGMGEKLIDIALYVMLLGAVVSTVVLVFNAITGRDDSTKALMWLVGFCIGVMIIGLIKQGIKT